MYTFIIFTEEPGPDGRKRKTNPRCYDRYLNLKKSVYVYASWFTYHPRLLF